MPLAAARHRRRKYKQALLFEKKEAKKILLRWATGCVTATTHAPQEQKFFGSFFQKRTAFARAFL
jgi:hypothetical protein